MFMNSGFQQQPIGFAPQMGMAPQQPNPNNYRVASTLTPEQIAMLQNQGNTFSLQLTEEEMLRAICNHRSADGLSDTLVYDPVNGTAKCQICGYEFRPIEADINYDEIKEDINRVKDIIQTTKLMYLDLPQQAAKDYYPILGLLEKLPQLVEYAAKNMAKHDNYGYMYDQRNMGAAAMFANLSNMFSNMSMNYQQAPQQPQYNGYYGQPAGFPQAAYPQPNMNPFGYNGSAAPQYAPGTPQNFAYTPNGAAPQTSAAAPASTPAADTATVNQTVSV